jgi:seryl-tRNA synthetase
MRRKKKRKEKRKKSKKKRKKKKQKMKRKKKRRKKRKKRKKNEFNKQPNQSCVRLHYIPHITVYVLQKHNTNGSSEYHVVVSYLQHPTEGGNTFPQSSITTHQPTL